MVFQVFKGTSNLAEDDARMCRMVRLQCVLPGLRGWQSLKRVCAVLLTEKPVAQYFGGEATSDRN